MIETVPMYGFGSSGGSCGTLTVTAPAGVTATVTTNFNRIHTVDSKTESGVTVTVNSDKSITINGTATADVWLSLNGNEGLYNAEYANGFIYRAGVDLTGTGVQMYYNELNSSGTVVASSGFLDTVDRYTLKKRHENTAYFELALRILPGSTFDNLTIANTLLPANPKTKTKQVEEDGVAVFKGLTHGFWKLSIADGNKTAQKTVTITTNYSTYISFSTIPDFTYTGDFEIVNDADAPITISQGNWKVRFLTSGTLTFTELNGAENGIDVFLVGGGGGNPYITNSNTYGGAGGGYTKTGKGVSVNEATTYDITIGAGGAGTSGGTTSAFGYSASGGETGGASDGTWYGGNGGSGGGGSSTNTPPAAGGSDGGNGGSGYKAGGTGQGTTTREFGDPSGKLYAGGGGGYNESGRSASGGDGGGAAGGSSASANTGGGAGGNYRFQLSGGSGIVIIRNKR